MQFLWQKVRKEFCGNWAIDFRVEIRRHKTTHERTQTALRAGIAVVFCYEMEDTVIRMRASSQKLSTIGEECNV